jgi:hypothetical protein
LVIRLLLSGDIARVLACEDIWRCNDCRACSRACPMQIDIAGVLSRLRSLELDHGAQRCPEREAARVAVKHLARRKHVNNIAFGVAMASRGYLPWDVRGAVGAIAHAVVPRRLTAKTKEPADPAAEAGGTAFFAGCALRQEPASYALTQRVARDLGLPIVEAEAAACCGHPVRGHPKPALPSSPVALTVCPGCESSLRAAGIATTPLWEALVAKARRQRRRLSAIAPGFVPYVGCMGDRDRALGALAEAASLAGIKARMSYPSLHAGCCGALGSMYRGETVATGRLFEFAREQGLPVVTTCLLCRDNLRSAAHKQRTPVQVHFWPEFFQAAPTNELNIPGEIHDGPRNRE